MILNGICVPIFQRGNSTGIGLGTVVIIGLLITNMKMFLIIQSHRKNLNVWETIFIRFGFIIYAGWVTSTTFVKSIFIYICLLFFYNF